MIELRSCARAAPRLTRSRGGDGPGTLEGYAAVFHSADDPGTEFVLWDGPGGRVVERIARGAFKRAIDEADDVRGLVNHNPDLIIGRTAAGTLKLTEDGRGLRFVADLPDTAVGRDLAEVVARGDVSGCSFGFVIERETWRESEGDDGRPLAVRTVESVRLLDVGPVTYPAYASASVGGRSARRRFDERAARKRRLRLMELELELSR